MGTRNDLAAEREGIKGAWSQVDAALQLRNGLIPHLVEAVKGFAKQDQSIVDSVAKAHAAMVDARTPGEKIQADSEIRWALGRLFVMVENYPNLKSNQNFLRLLDELAETDNLVAKERQKYNDAVKKYNTGIELFPKNIAAKMFAFQRENAYFTAAVGSSPAGYGGGRR